MAVDHVPLPHAKGVVRNFRQRVISALLLMPIGLMSVHLGGLWLGGAAAIVGVLMAFEWARMEQPERPWLNMFIMGIGAAVCAILAGALRFQWLAVWLISAAAVASVCAFITRRSFTAMLESFSGTIYVGAPGAAFVFLREHGSFGASFCFYLLAVIWATDIAAYAVGKAIGGPRILPETSPGKTWAGSIGGVLAAAGTGYALALGFGYAQALALGFAAAILSIVGQCGDMFESLVKRHFNVKDASCIIPGHGGVLDRLDSLLAAILFSVLMFGAWPGLADWLLARAGGA